METTTANKRNTMDNETAECFESSETSTLTLDRDCAAVFTHLKSGESFLGAMVGADLAWMGAPLSHKERDAALAWIADGEGTYEGGDGCIVNTSGFRVEG